MMHGPYNWEKKARCKLRNELLDTTLVSSVKDKGKTHPRIGHEGPAGEMYSYTLSLTSALDGVVVKATPGPLYLRESEPVSFVQEVGWDPGPVWSGAENLTPHRDSIRGPSGP